MTKDFYTELFLKEAGKETSQEFLEKFRPVFWHSFRNKDSGGLRLTEQGLEFIKTKSDIKTYKIDFPKEVSLTPQIYIWLDRFIESPYFITKKSIEVLNERSAFELYLFSGDVKKYGLSKTLAKRLSQETSTEE
jgi:hypothetical protein